MGRETLSGRPSGPCVHLPRSDHFYGEHATNLSHQNVHFLPGYANFVELLWIFLEIPKISINIFTNLYYNVKPKFF